MVPDAQTPDLQTAASGVKGALNATSVQIPQPFARGKQKAADYGFNMGVGMLMGAGDSLT